MVTSLLQRADAYARSKIDDPESMDIHLERATVKEHADKFKRIDQAIRKTRPPLEVFEELLWALRRVLKCVKVASL